MSTENSSGYVADFFREIDTDAKAWLLGFIGADGNVNRKRLAIRLHSKDREILERIRDIIAPHRPVRDMLHPATGRSGRESVQSELTVFNVEMIRDLNRHGIVPRKSLVYAPWGGPAELMPGYWRGMIDGDGSWYQTAGGNRWGLSLCGTKATCEAFSDWAAGHGAHVPVRQHRTVYVAHCTGSAGCKRVAQVLYAHETISLARKREKVAILLNTDIHEYGDWSEMGAEELASLRGRFGSWHKVAKHLNTSPQNLSNIRGRRNMEREQWAGRPTTFKGMTAEKLLSLYESLGSWHKVALHLGHKTGTAHQLRQRLGLCD